MGSPFRTQVAYKPIRVAGVSTMITPVATLNLVDTPATLIHFGPGAVVNGCPPP